MMPRAATTTDVFNAIAESRRRAIIGVLVDGRTHTVGEIMGRLRMPQPAVSKHLGVLREVGIVSARKKGRLRLYRLNAEELKPVHDWVKGYERFWTNQLDRIKERAERKAAERSADPRARGKDHEAKIRRRGDGNEHLRSGNSGAARDGDGRHRGADRHGI